jgi:hypothetical protein
MMYQILTEYGPWKEQIMYCVNHTGPEIRPQAEISDLFDKRASLGVPAGVIVEDTIRLLTEPRALELPKRGLLEGSLVHVNPESLPCGLAQRAIAFQRSLK